MLTMTRLISAFMVAFIGWVVAGLVKVRVLQDYETYNFGHFVLLSVVIGWFVGWFVLGSRANGRLGFGTAPAVGLTASIALVFWVLLLVSFNEMLRQAMARSFDGAMEAINEIVVIMLDFGRYLIDRDILLTLLIGGMIAGWVADWSARRWK